MNGIKGERKNKQTNQPHTRAHTRNAIDKNAAFLKKGGSDIRLSSPTPIKMGKSERVREVCGLITEQKRRREGILLRSNFAKVVVEVKGSGFVVVTITEERVEVEIVQYVARLEGVGEIQTAKFLWVKSS